MGGSFTKTGGLLPELSSTSLIKISIIGLENSGKSSLLSKFIDNTHRKAVQSVLVSQGVYADMVNYKGWDIFVGNLLYPNYIRKAFKPYLLLSDIIIFIVDSSDYQQISSAKEQIDILLGENCINSTVFLVLANKQDIKRITTPQLENYLELSRLNCPYNIMPVSVLKETNLDETIKWILKQLDGHIQLRNNNNNNNTNSNNNQNNNNNTS
ncbi:ADP-ribosylation like factor [Cavenderia fasciculata]|uniref:ADP-ribosylation like factor n=1 Tax=Cavenderia fasciculata TaxID=261658 RepID=F4PI02_CACFS|nr:ADP-ribosylation like factor [Cavenderia fasciculata]EGG24489.1 ADP-ribosylation like factor [Cavenderia fasciculata]|eukprot:XP_004362340.1 ADP-ribosylation like factor [Cavenderia fasciculata]